MFYRLLTMNKVVIRRSFQELTGIKGIISQID